MKDQDRNDRESLEEIQAETTVSKNQTEQKQHKRRVRYKGTHPRSYQEKYKELQPEKYPETIVKVEKDSFSVQTGDGLLKVLALQIPGKKRMEADAFLRGYQIETGCELSSQMIKNC